MTIYAPGHLENIKENSVKYVYLFGCSIWKIGAHHDNYSVKRAIDNAFNSAWPDTGKIFVVGNEVADDSCKITELYNKTDKREFHCPCASCEVFFVWKKINLLMIKTGE